MIQNLHTHTTFCDGKNTAEEMVLDAISKGLTSLGFSGHAPLPITNTWAMTRETLPQYIAEVHRLQAKYEGQLEIFLGLENEYILQTAPTPFDYTICSVHMIEQSGQVEIDNTSELLVSSVTRYYGADPIGSVHDYYDLVVKAAGCGDILGHFDLICKFNDKTGLYQETESPYLDIASEALVACMEQDVIVELNTGAMARGNRSVPYPNPQFYDLIAEKKGRVVITSDAHSTDALGYYYNESVELLKSHGIFTQQMLTKNGFIEVPL
ncbi:MAG: histidinol-phosphatase [Eubacteriales bacterium]